MKIFHSLLFRGLSFYLLAFIFFTSVFFNQLMVVPINFFLFVGFSLIGLFLLTYLLVKLRISAQMASDHLNKFLPKEIIKKIDAKNLSELDVLYAQSQAFEEHFSLENDRLENQIQRLDDVLAYIFSGLISTDRKGKIVLANAAIDSLLDVDHEELIGRDITEVLGLAEQYNFHRLMIDQPRLTIPKVIDSLGAEYMEIRFSNIRDNSGMISGMVALIRDTSVEVQEEKKRQQFLSNVSHELRTPLTVISSYLESLDDGALENPELARPFIKTSIKETSRLIRIVNDLLALSRISSEESKGKREVIHLQDFLSYHITRLRQTISTSPIYSKRGFEIVCDFPEEEIWVDADADKAGQAIDNLVTNALKYSPNGGLITLGMRIEGELKNKVHLWISDQGQGIPKKELSKIFDRFYRVDVSRNSTIPGTGLGLALVHDIVELHNGSIYAESDGMTGTTIHILLPYDKNLMNDLDNDF